MCHSRRGKPMVKDFATTFPAQFRYSPHCVNCIFQPFHDESCMTFFHHLGNCPAAVGNHRRATGHRFNDDKPERLWPVDREKQSVCVAEEFLFLSFADLSHELHKRMAQQRLDYGLKIILVHPIDLCSELKWDANLLRNFDCPIDSFLGRNPPQKSKISSRFVAKLIHVCWQTVVHRGLPVRHGNGSLWPFEIEITGISRNSW